MSATTTFVNSTLGLVASIDTRRAARLTLQLAVMDATQTFTGWVRRAADPALSSAASPLPDFSGVGPAGSVDTNGNPADTVMVDLDVTGTPLVELYGKMSGAGGNVKWAAVLS